MLPIGKRDQINRLRRVLCGPVSKLFLVSVLENGQVQRILQATFRGSSADVAVVLG